MLQQVGRPWVAQLVQGGRQILKQQVPTAKLKANRNSLIDCPFCAQTAKRSTVERPTGNVRPSRSVPGGARGSSTQHLPAGLLESVGLIDHSPIASFRRPSFKKNHC